MKFRKSVIMATLIAASLAPSLAQTSPPKPTAATERATPAKAAKVEGLLAWFGDTADKVKAAYHSNQEVESNPGEKYPTVLSLTTEGVFCYFDGEGKLRQIRLDEPAAGKINGVGVGDSLAQMLKQLGPPTSYHKASSPNPAFPDAYVYNLGDVTAGFDVKPRDKVVSTLWLTRETR